MVWLFIIVPYLLHHRTRDITFIIMPKFLIVKFLMKMHDILSCIKLFAIDTNYKWFVKYLSYMYKAQKCLQSMRKKCVFPHHQCEKNCWSPWGMWKKLFVFMRDEKKIVRFHLNFVVTPLDKWWSAPYHF